MGDEEQKNKALVRWWWEEVWLKGNVAATDEFMAPNYVDHPNLPGPTTWPRGHEAGAHLLPLGFSRTRGHHR